MSDCSECQGRGWVARLERLLDAGEHRDYPHGFTEYWWEPCESCNPDNRRKLEQPLDEPSSQL